MRRSWTRERRTHWSDHQNGDHRGRATREWAYQLVPIDYHFDSRFSKTYEIPIIKLCRSISFTNSIPVEWNSALKQRKIEPRYIMPYHPQANLAETRMKIIADCFRELCSTKHRRWIEFISTVEKRLNKTPHRTTGIEPSTLFLQRKFTITGASEPISNTLLPEVDHLTMLILAVGRCD